MVHQFRTPAFVFTLMTALTSFVAHAQTSPSDSGPARCEERGPMQMPLQYESVQTHSDGSVTFLLCAPKLESVRVKSSDMAAIPMGFDGKPAGLPMTRNAAGFWQATTASAVKPGVYRYSFETGGVDFPDPQGTSFSHLAKGIRSVVEIRSPETDWESYLPGVAHGAVSHIDYPSSTLSAIRQALVYTPPGYEAGGTKRYPVLYLVHGAGDSQDSWTSIGHAQYIMDNLLAAKKAVPMIIVMPFGHTPDRAGVDRMQNVDFGNDLIKDLIPYIDAHYRTVPTAPKRAMAGLSMGGAHTLNFGLPRSDLFSDIGVFSMGLFTPEFVSMYKTQNAAALDKRARAKGIVYYAMGKDDFLYASVAPTREVMDAHGIRYLYRETAGGHTWENWRDYLADFLPRIFTAKP